MSDEFANSQDKAIRSQRHKKDFEMDSSSDEFDEGKEQLSMKNFPKHPVKVSGMH